MENFMGKAAEYALGEKVPKAADPQDWAATAFSVIALLGGHNDINDEIGDLLAQLLAKADDFTVVSGTMRMVTGYGNAVELLNTEIPDDLSGLDPNN